MRTTIDPGIDRPTIFLLDHIVYSHVQNLGGQPLDLDLSLMLPLQNNGEMRRIFGNNQPEERPDATTAPQAAKPAAPKRPVILWFNGNGFRGIDKNCQVADLEFLAEAGYAVAFVQVRSSAQGPLPAQLIDALTAIRFLRANAGKYNLDPLRFGVAGRSAGGMIVSMLGLNDNRFLSEEWKGYSSDVQAVWDLFGLVDMAGVTEEQVEAYRNGTADTSRWSRMEDTHTGAVLGGDVDTMAQRAREYSVIRYIHGNMPPFLIMHGDADPMIPLEQSEMLYNSMLSWEGNKADLYVVKGAGHGTPEFFQPAVQKIALDFFARNMFTGRKEIGIGIPCLWAGCRRPDGPGRGDPGLHPAGLRKGTHPSGLRLRDRRDRGSDPGRFQPGKVYL